MAKHIFLLSLFYIVLSVSGTINIDDNDLLASTAAAPGPSAVSAGGEAFLVQGRVYCDPCRIQFPTRISYNLANTKVTLACRDRETESETYRVEGVTDGTGQYSITAVGDHEEEICEVSVKDSPDPNCPFIMDDESKGRVALTNKNGVKGEARYANPIGFMVKEADNRCKQVLDELGFTGINN